MSVARRGVPPSGDRGTRTRNAETRLRLKGEEGTQKDFKRAAVRVARRLEGSRFVARQLYRLAAGGSRERLDVRQFYRPLYPDNKIDAMGKTLR